MEMEDESSNSVEDHPFIIDSLADIMGELSEEEREETPKPTISQCNRYVYFNGKRIPKPSRVMELQRRGQLSSNLSPELLAYMYLDDEDLGLLFESHDPMQTLRVLYKEGFEQSDGETADPITKQELIEDAIKLKRLRDEGVISELPPLTEAAMNELIASAEDPSNKGSRTSKTEEAGTKHYNEGPLERRNREIVLQLIEHFPEEARVAGFKKDCATLLSNFYNTKDHSWEDFSKVWNRMRFSRVFNFHQIFGYRDLEKLYGVHNAEERIHEGVIDPKNDDMQYYINRQMVRDGDECDDSVWNSVDNNQGENASSDKMENDGSENDENTVSDQKEGEGGDQEVDDGIDQEENDSSDQEEEDNIDEEEKASSVQSEPGESLVNSEKGNASGSVFQKYNIDSDVDDDNPDSNDDDIDAVEDRLIMQQVLRNRKKEKKNEKKARDNVDKSNDTKPVTEDEKNRAYAKIIMKMEDEEEWRLNFIRETTPKMFFIPKIFMLPEFPQPVRKGAIFMMYAMYYKQPFNAKCRPLTPDDDLEDEDDSEEEMQDETEEEMQDETEEEIQIETEDEIQDETEEKIHDETEKKKQVETEEKIQDESHENIQAVTHEETTNETQATRRRKSKGNFRFKYSKKFRKSQRLAKKQSKTQEETQDDEEKMKKREEQKMKRMEESRMKQEEEKEKKEEEKKKKRESKKKFKRKYKKKNEEEERKKEEFKKWNNVKAFYFDFDLTEFSLFRQIRDVESDEAQFQLNHIFTKMLEDSGIMMSGTFHDPMQMSISDLERAYYVRLYEEREGLKDPQQKIWWNEAIENYKRSTDEVAANSSLWNTVVKSSNKGDPSEIEHLLIPERPQHVVGKLEPSVTKNVSKSIKDYLAEYTEEITDTPDSPYELILLDDSDNLPPLRDAAAIIEVEMTPSEVDLTTIPSTEPSTSKAPTVRGPVIKMDRSTPSTSKGPAVATSIVDHSTPSTSKGPAVATSIVDRSTPSTSKKPAVATSIVDRSTPSTSKGPP